MLTKQLSLEVSDSLYQKLEQLAYLTEESIEDIAISMIAKNISSSTQQAKDLKEKIDNLSIDSLPEMIDTGNLTGVEIV